MAKGGGGFPGKPMKSAVTGNYGKAVSSAAKIMGTQRMADMATKPKLPKKPPKGRPPVSY